MNTVLILIVFLIGETAALFAGIYIGRNIGIDKPEQIEKKVEAKRKEALEEKRKQNLINAMTYNGFPQRRDKQ